MHIIAQTPRLIIREFLPEELEVYLDHFTDEEVCLYIPKRSRDERITIFQNALNNYAGSKQLGTWGMFKIDGEFIGSCLLRQFDTEPGKVELGYSLNKKDWGKGYATEMAEAMITHALADSSTTEVVAVTEIPNIGSQRVLEKAGMEQLDNFMRGGLELAYFRKGRS